jgi:glucose/mannose-6-phosphate isomerase
MTFLADESILDDPEALEAADSAAMLRSLAFSGARARQAVTLVRESGLERFAADGRPRAVLLAGLGTAARVAQAVVALVGAGAPVPVVARDRADLPGWAGPLDLVVVLARAGRDDAARTVAEHAARRGCRLITVGSAHGDLVDVTRGARGLHLSTALLPGEGPDTLARSAFWPLLIPALGTMEAVGVARFPVGLFVTVADLLDEVSTRCRPASDSFVNVAKSLALELGGCLPLIWATSELTGVAGDRFADQLVAAAGYPALVGVLPAAATAQGALLRGPFGPPAADEQDFFRDRVEEAEERARLRLVLVTEGADPMVAPELTGYARQLAEERGLPVSELVGAGEHPLERLATLVALADYTSLYLAFASGFDPSVPELAEAPAPMRPSERLP